jgi:hypothetical protein
MSAVKVRQQHEHRRRGLRFRSSVVPAIIQTFVNGGKLPVFVTNTRELNQAEIKRFFTPKA